MSRLRVLARRVANNWRLKLASLALAVLLWALVRAEQRTEQWVTVRVEPHILDPGFTLTGRSEPRLVQVRFAGRWRELGELAIERPVLFLHVRNIGRERTFALDPSMVRLPDHLGGSVTALDVRPGTVRLPLQRTPARSGPARTQRLDAADRLPVVEARTMPALPAADSAALTGAPAPDTVAANP